MHFTRRGGGGLQVRVLSEQSTFGDHQQLPSARVRTLPPLGATFRLAFPVVGALGFVGRALGLLMGAGGFLLIARLGLAIGLEGPAVGAAGLGLSRMDGLLLGRFGAGGFTKTVGRLVDGGSVLFGVFTFRGPVGVSGPRGCRAGGLAETPGL